jgi:uncharacterized OB-fold protein
MPQNPLSEPPEMLLPTPTRDSAPYWKGLAEGILKLQHCSTCNRHLWPPRPICSACGGSEMTWQVLSGKGSLYSWVITHHAYLDALSQFTPYVVALVRLEEQDDILIPGRLLGLNAEAIESDMDLSAVFEKITIDIGLMNWKPATNDPYEEPERSDLMESPGNEQRDRPTRSRPPII